MMSAFTRAPRGELSTYECESFRDASITYAVYRKGKGPAVLVITEMPGISPMVLGFADRIVALGCTAVLPDLFGDAGRDPDAGSTLSRVLYHARAFAQVCVRREFTTFAQNQSAPLVDWLRALGAREHARCGGPGVGVVGMCFSGGFALAMAADARVLAPVLSQPSLPVATTRASRSAIDCSPEDLARVKQRCAADGLRVLGLRFHGDPLVPAERFQFLRAQLGDAFVSVELEQAHGNPGSPMPKHHSVLTRDLIDEPGEPTRVALEQVLALLQDKLLPHAGHTAEQAPD
jgi:dienelactone hydrolase